MLRFSLKLICTGQDEILSLLATSRLMIFAVFEDPFLGSVHIDICFACHWRRSELSAHLLDFASLLNNWNYSKTSVPHISCFSEAIFNIWIGFLIFLSGLNQTFCADTQLFQVCHFIGKLHSLQEQHTHTYLARHWGTWKGSHLPGTLRDEGGTRNRVFLSEGAQCGGPLERAPLLGTLEDMLRKALDTGMSP